MNKITPLFHSWLLLPCFLAAAVLVPLTYQLQRHQHKLPDTLPALIEQLQALHPSWQFEPAVGDPALCHGAYLMQAGYVKDYWPPPRFPKYDRYWRGLVFIQLDGGSHARFDNAHVASWGEHGVRLGRFVFYGDPGMLAAIRNKLLRAGG